MDFSLYAQPRKFARPRLKKTECVGADAVLWALVSGPVFFWRKGALIAGIIAGLATLPFWGIASEGYLADVIGGLVWLGAAALAPLLLAASYRRRGWIDVTDTRRPLDLDDDGETVEKPSLGPEEHDGLLLPPRHGRRLLDLEEDIEMLDEQPAPHLEPDERDGLRLPPRRGRRLLDLEDANETLDGPHAPRLEPEEQDGLLLPPRRGRLLDMEESDLD
jgi:hypothetical protein